MAQATEGDDMAFGRKPTEDVEWLSGVEFFEGFSDQELHRVIDLSEQVEAPAGTVLVDQGDPGTDCFVIVDGTASVYVRGEHVASSGPGSMVGEMALIDHRPRTATVVADDDMRLLRFKTKAFRTLLDEMPKASERVMTVLRSRLERQEADKA
jgi:CRP/FNR family transcriptional regulator, cyclic AMP receptor protein